MSEPQHPEVAAASTEREERAASIAKNTAIVTGFVALGRVAGILRTPILSRFIGTTGAADTLFFAYDTVLRDLYTKVEKLLQPTFIPLFVSRKDSDGEKTAWSFAGVFATLHFCLLVAIGLGGFLLAEPIAQWLYHGNTELVNKPDAVLRLTLYLRLFFPALLAYSLSNLTELMLQSYKRFALPAFAEAFVRISMIATLVAAVVLLGRPTVRQATDALVLGALIGVVGRLLIMLPGLWSKLRFFRPSLDLSNPDMRRAFVLMIPLVVGILLAYARNVAEAKMAFSFGEGAFSALRYARKFVDLPWQILGIAVSMVIYPFISELGARKEREELAGSLMSTTRVLLFFFVPVTAVCYVLAEPLARLSYYGMKFDERALQNTLVPLVFYLPGMAFFAIEDPLLKWFYAMKDTKTPIALGVMSDLLWATVVIVGVLVLHAQLQALALALVLSKATKVCVAFGILNRRIGPLPWGRLAAFLGKLLAATAAMTVASLAGAHVFLKVLPFGDPMARAAAEVVVVGSVSVVVVSLLSYLFRIEECAMVAAQVRKRLGR